MQFIRRYTFIFGLIFVCLLPLVFYTSKIKFKRSPSSLEYAFYMVIQPLHNVVYHCLSWIDGTWQHYFDLKNTKSQWLALKTENTKLKLKEQIIAEIINENNRLRKALGMKKYIPMPILPAQVKSFDPSFLYQSIRISVGAKEGVAVGMAVVAQEGVVGTVVQVLAHESEVLLTTDPNSRLDILVGRNRHRAIVEGTGLGRMVLKYAPEENSIFMGDEIFSSDLIGPFPQGLPVGTVSQISVENSQTRIEVQPFISWQDLSEVFVIINKNKELEELKQLAGSQWFDRILKTKDE